MTFSRHVSKLLAVTVVYTCLFKMILTLVKCSTVQQDIPLVRSV